MQDAFNLAWKLALVIHGICRQELLDSYSPELSYVGDQVLKSAGALTTVGTLRNPIAQTLRDVVGHLMLGLTTVQHAFADNMTMVTVGYPDSPLNGPSLRGAGPKPGHRLPPIAGQIAPRSGTNPQFMVLAEPSPAITALIEEFSELVDATLGAPPRDDGIWVIRPDGYVACASNDANAVGDYLRQLTP